MSNKQHRFALAALIVTSFPGVSAGYAQDSAADANPLNIQTTDYLVPHISTVPANAGKYVELFVREKVASGRAGKAPVVLMISGATISADPILTFSLKTIAGWNIWQPLGLTSLLWMSQVMG